MNQEYFEKISDIVKKAQEPLQAITELNVKTLQSYAYIKPEEFSKITKPEDLLEKQLGLALDNGRIALEYIQKSFHIIEKLLLTCSKEVIKEAKSKDGKS